MFINSLMISAHKPSHHHLPIIIIIINPIYNLTFKDLLQTLHFSNVISLSYFPRDSFKKSTIHSSTCTPLTLSLSSSLLLPPKGSWSIFSWLKLKGVALNNSMGGHGDHHRERNKKESDNDDDEDGTEYEVQDLRDRIKSSRGSRFNLLENEFGLVNNTESSLITNLRRKLSRESVVNGIRYVSTGPVIHPDNRSVILFFLLKYLFFYIYNLFPWFWFFYLTKASIWLINFFFF